MREQETTPPWYSASEMVRLELLAYEQTQGLHPVERGWRDLAKKLLEHVKMLDKALESKSPSYGKEKHVAYKFPEPYTDVGAIGE